MSACIEQSPFAIIQEAGRAADRGDKAAFLACFTERSQSIIESYWGAAEDRRSDLLSFAAGDLELLEIRERPSYDGRRKDAIVSFSEGSVSAALYLHQEGLMWRIDLLDSERLLLAE